MRIACILFLIFITACKSKQLVVNNNWAVLNFVKVDSINPILTASNKQKFNCPLRNTTVAWSEKNVLNPAAIVKNDKVYLLYRSQDSNMTSRIGLAVSMDGLHFLKMAEPILFPAADSMQRYEWKGGVEDPRIVESENGMYILTYTAYDGKTARLCLATSTDLLHWKKQGLVLCDEKYANTWSKSGAIVATQKGNKIIATKINGKYWMYFGDTNLFIATSTDLIHWAVAENEETKKMVTVLHPRLGFFDSRLVEPGPFALLQQDGIHLIYNGSNAANYNDNSLAKFTYSAGQALFNKEKPYQLINQSTIPFIKPDKPYERVGEVNEVCFVEGLVYFNNKWFLYYGTADSKIAVAVME
jgi:beta-1,2-mannosidase